jgi:uncharacterized DUF497 family protein
MEFEWDPRKAAINLRKHEGSFTEAGTFFGDELAITVTDPDHSEDENRYITIDWSNRRRLLWSLMLIDKAKSGLSVLVN